MHLIQEKPSAGITGFQGVCDEHTMLELSLDELVLHPSASFLAIASGDSMESAGIFDGDMLLVDRSLKERTGDVIVGVLNGEFVCKKIDVENRLLLSANPQFPSVTISEHDEFTVEGVIPISFRFHRPHHLLARACSL